MPVAGLVGFYVVFQLIDPFSGYDLLLFHFVAGFVFFLRDNFPAISWDAGTWGPGVMAFLMTIILAHRPLKKWARKTNRYWTLATTVSLALIVPALFVISFIVPGILLQWELLRHPSTGAWIVVD